VGTPVQTTHDPFARTFRADTLRTGVWPTIFVCLLLSLYYAWTWEEPNRFAMLMLVVAALACTVGVVSLPVARLIGGPWCEPFFLTWSASLTAMVALGCVLDGGATSPMTALLFLPLVYAALSYPLGSMLAVGAMSLGAYLAVTAVGDAPSAQHVFLFSGAIVNATWICGWQSRNHDLHRRHLQRVSRTDPLTGCLNRRGFQERLEAELARAHRGGHDVALVVVDLDGFKAINDHHGHAAGDEVLRWVAQRLRDELRTEDMVGRLGGDEFAIVLSGSEPTGAVERILGSLSERAPASAGVAVFPGDGVDPEDLHRVADAMLYQRKHGRRWTGTGGADRELSWAAALASAVDERMAVRHEHSHTVASYAGAIARRLGWAEPEVERVRLAAMLHDVGKVRVPDTILRKPGPLDDDEWAEITKHPVTGAEIVARVEGLEPIGPWIRHSHERIDGTGYPDGLCGDAIPLASRILLVADAFDAMTSDRSYRRAMSREAALAELELHRGSQFDARCVRALQAELAERDDAPLSVR
jgi:diguanylate cyclase (GGDEF)-like protein/putative nucleotidyltransferase with HDIG domain